MNEYQTAGVLVVLVPYLYERPSVLAVQPLYVSLHVANMPLVSRYHLGSNTVSRVKEPLALAKQESYIIVNSAIRHYHFFLKLMVYPKFYGVRIVHVHINYGCLKVPV